MCVAVCYLKIMKLKTFGVTILTSSQKQDIVMFFQPAVYKYAPGGHGASAGFFCSTSSPPGLGLLPAPPPPGTEKHTYKEYIFYAPGQH